MIPIKSFYAYAPRADSAQSRDHRFVRNAPRRDITNDTSFYKFHILGEHPELSDVNQIAEALEPPAFIAQGEATEKGRNDPMATITIPESVKGYFPQKLDPVQLWVSYNSSADSLTAYFTDSGVIGTKAFVARCSELFETHFSSCHTKHPRPIAGLPGVYALKRLSETRLSA